MKFITLITALAATVPAVLANLTINTPSSVVTCEPTQLQWSGGVAPYYISLVPAGQTSATPIEQFPTQNGTTYTWNVNILQGTSFTIVLKDSTGTSAFSDIVTVQAGTTTSCVTASASVTGAASTAGSGSTAAGASTSGGSTATGTAAAGSSASSTSSASGSSSTNSSGAGRIGVSSAFGVATLMGLVGAAFF